MLLRALKDFVNTGDSSKEWSRLKKWWPDLLPQETYDLAFDRVHALNQQFGTTKVLDLPRCGVDLLEPGISYHPQPDNTVIFFLEALELRDQLRRIWRDAQTANDLLPTMFTVRARPDLLPSILGLKEKKRGFNYYCYSSNAEGTDDLRELMGSFTLRVDWVRSSLIPQFETEFQRACYALLKNSARAKFCQNPDCPAPYFIARRATQKYCHPDCLKPIQKKWKLNWWNRVGSKRRTSTNSRRSPDSRSERKRDSDA